MTAREEVTLQIANFILACLPGQTTLTYEQREKILEQLIIGGLKMRKEKMAKVK